MLASEKTLKKQKQFPHSLIIIFLIICVSIIMTWIVPAGKYEKVVDPKTQREVVDPTSYHRVEGNPASPFDAFRAIPKGMTGGAWIVFLVIIIGGSFTVINSTHATTAYIGKYLSKVQGDKSIYSLPLLTLPFFLLPAITGNGESMLAFLPMGIIIAKSLGFDTFTGVAIVTIASSTGFAAGLLSPASVGTAQAIIGLPVFSGLWFRIIGAVLLFMSQSFWIVKYAKDAKRDPKRYSLSYEVDQSKEGSEKYDLSDPMFQITPRKTLCLIEFLIGIAVIVYAALNKWDFKTDVPAIFILMAVVIGLTAGYKPNEIASKFVEGGKLVLVGGMVAGFGRGISIILTESNIIDTIVHALATVASSAPSFLAAPVMLIVQSLINCFIISASGQAAATIPIMSPLGDILHLSQQTVVMAFLYGDGFSNILLPMNASIMGACAISGVTYPKYIKYTYKLYLTNMVIGMILCFVADLINLGPF